MTPPKMPDFSEIVNEIEEEEDLQSDFRLVAVDRIVIDHKVQRAKLNKQKLNAMVAKFYAPALGTLVLSERKNGTFIALDGWHRSEVCKLVPTAPAALHCRVFHGLTLQQEARLFRLLNQSTTMHAVDLFRAESVEGSERAQRIISIIEEYGGKISTDSFSAVKTALRIVERPNGFDLLDRALDIISDAWTTVDKRSLDGRIVEGLTTFLEYHGEVVDVKWFKGSLKKLGADGAKQIVDLAKPYHAARGGRVAVAVCDVLTGVYNKGKRDAAKLPDYQRR